jgi:hypothetical protein
MTSLALCSSEAEEVFDQAVLMVPRRVRRLGAEAEQMVEALQMEALKMGALLMEA